jgi:hypothetical protein
MASTPRKPNKLTAARQRNGKQGEQEKSRFMRSSFALDPVEVTAPPPGIVPASGLSGRPGPLVSFWRAPFGGLLGRFSGVPEITALANPFNQEPRNPGPNRQARSEHKGFGKNVCHGQVLPARGRRADHRVCCRPISKPPNA